MLQALKNWTGMKSQHSGERPAGDLLHSRNEAQSSLWSTRMLELTVAVREDILLGHAVSCQKGHPSGSRNVFFCCAKAFRCLLFSAMYTPPRCGIPAAVTVTIILPFFQGKVLGWGKTGDMAAEANTGKAAKSWVHPNGELMQRLEPFLG